MLRLLFPTFVLSLPIFTSTKQIFCVCDYDHSYGIDKYEDDRPHEYLRARYELLDCFLPAFYCPNRTDVVPKTLIVPS